MKSITSPVQLIRRERANAMAAIQAARDELLALEANLNSERPSMTISRSLHDIATYIHEAVSRLDIAVFMDSTRPSE